MSWPRRRTSAREAQLQRANDALALQLLWVKSELTRKERYAGRLKYLLRQRTERVDELTGKLEAARTMNQRLDQECERLVEMMQLSPK